MTRRRAGRSADPATRAALKNVDLADRIEQANQLSAELDVAVTVLGSGSFSVLGGYTAESAEGVRRLVARLRSRPK